MYVGQVGFWLPWDPDPMDVADQEYADGQLNELMKKYKENESQRDEFYAETKKNKLAGAKIRDASTVGPAVESAPPSGMFEGEDLAIRRKKEVAAGGDKITHSK